MRGAAAGLLTAALTLAAHSAGGGAIPSGAGAVQLCIVALIVGAVAAGAPHADRGGVLLGVLAAGQVAGHVVLSAQGHIHDVSGAYPALVMPIAHLVAIVAGAVLIGVGERLCGSLSCVAQRVAGMPRLPAFAPRPTAPEAADHPMRSALLLACSISYRGPPVSTAP